MTTVAISGDQLKQAGELIENIQQLQGLIDSLQKKAEQYPFTKDQLAMSALEAKMAANRIYKLALAA